MTEYVEAGAYAGVHVGPSASTSLCSAQPVLRAGVSARGCAEKGASSRAGRARCSSCGTGTVFRNRNLRRPSSSWRIRSAPAVIGSAPTVASGFFCGMSASKSAGRPHQSRPTLTAASLPASTRWRVCRASKGDQTSGAVAADAFAAVTLFTTSINVYVIGRSRLPAMRRSGPKSIGIRESYAARPAPRLLPGETSQTPPTPPCALLARRLGVDKRGVGAGVEMPSVEALERRSSGLQGIVAAGAGGRTDGAP